MTTDHEIARLTALAEYQRADALSENALERLTTLAARLFRVPTAFVSLIDDQRQIFTSRYGLSISGTARRMSFCDHTLAQGGLLCVSDALNGHIIGTVCLTDTAPRPPLTEADRQHLTDIAALVMDRMEVHRLDQLRRGITFWNPAATAMFGHGPEEMAGQYVAGLIADRCQTDYRNELDRITGEDTAISLPRTMQTWGRRRDGQEFPAEVSFSDWREGDTRLVGMIVRDVTARHESEARMFELASLDMLTRLASRGAFMQQLTQLTEAGVSCMLLMMDLDGFKEVNDTLGHAAGDALLCHVAEQIRRVCTDAIIAARLGGDEFIILLPGRHDDAGSTAERLIAAVQTPFRYHGSRVVAGASTGIASCPEHGKDPSTLMSAADLALYRAKASGKGRSVHFRPAFREAEQPL